MKSSAIVSLCTALLVAVLVSTAGGAINPILTYQGFLRDNNGVPYPDGSYQFTFTIYPDSIDGTALWTETQLLEIADGLVHASLGSISPLGQSVFASAPLWLGVQLDAEPEFVPRHFIGSSVYAFLAADAEALGGFSPEHYADTTVLQQAVTQHESDPQSHRPLELDASEITTGVIDAARLPAPVVGGGEVVDGSLTSDDLADSTVTGEKIATGTIDSEHLSTSAFSGDNITDGSLTAVDLADSTVTGDKIATGAIESPHLSGVAITGEMIVDGSITGSDMAIAAVGFNEIEPQVISDYHLQNASISGFKLKANTVSGFEVEDQSIEAADLADNAIETRHLANNQITAIKIVDEPGVRETTGGLLTSVGTTATTWFSITVDVPAPGYIIAFFTGYTSLQANEAAQLCLSTTPNAIDERFVEARLSSGTSSFGGYIPTSINTVFTALSAGNVTINVNVRAATSSAGTIDMVGGGLQAIYIPTIY